MENLYEILKIDRNATQAEIKAAYRRLAAQYHPDVNNSEDAEEQFKAINFAHEILSDFYLRLQYEQEYDAFHGITQREEMEFTVTEESSNTVEEPVSPQEEPAPIEEKEPVFEQTTESEPSEDEKRKPIFPLKWKLALLATPFVILLGIGLLKIVVTLFTTQETAAEPAPNQPVPVVKKDKPSVGEQPKQIAIWELKRMAIAQPDFCIAFIDSVKTTDSYQDEMAEIREKAVKQLPAKTAYFFETNECERARKALRLLLDNQPELKPHTRKQLDFYNFRCATEAKNITLAMTILDEMLDRYQHDYSILAAKAQILHHQMKNPRAALAIYQKARLQYEYQKIDEKFIEYWKPDYKPFTFATLLANEALALYSLGDSDKTKAIAIRSINMDSTQTLAYELIGNQFGKEENKWGACKYWRKAMENGSTAVADSLVKYCE